MANPKNRVKRTPIAGQRNILTVEGKDPNYVYRVVNDVDGRIDKFLEAGYEKVTKDEHSMGETTVNTSNGVDSYVTKRVGTDQHGKPIVGHLMRIKREWYDEDQSAKQAQLDESEAALKRQLNSGADGTYGSVKITR